MDTIKKNEEFRVNYIAIGKTTGLTDLTLTVYDEGGIAFGAPIVMAEDAGGLYHGSFTPDAAGQWRITISSVVNHDDLQKVYDVVLATTDDVKTQTQSIEDKVDTIDGNVSQVLLDVAAVKLQTQSIEDKVDDVKTVVDSIDLQINVGGYIL